MTVADVAERTSSAVGSDADTGALFDETAGAYSRLRIRSEGIIIDLLSQNIREALRPYRHMYSSPPPLLNCPNTNQPSPQQPLELPHGSPLLKPDRPLPNRRARPPPNLPQHLAQLPRARPRPRAPPPHHARPAARPLRRPVGRRAHAPPLLHRGRDPAGHGPRRHLPRRRRLRRRRRRGGRAAEVRRGRAAGRPPC